MRDAHGQVCSALREKWWGGWEGHSFLHLLRALLPAPHLAGGLSQFLRHFNDCVWSSEPVFESYFCVHSQAGKWHPATKGRGIPQPVGGSFLGLQSPPPYCVLAPGAVLIKGVPPSGRSVRSIRWAGLMGTVSLLQSRARPELCREPDAMLRVRGRTSDETVLAAGGCGVAMGHVRWACPVGSAELPGLQVCRAPVPGVTLAPARSH